MTESHPPGKTRFWRVIGLLIAIVITSAILWSIWSETLLPLLREGDMRGLWLNLIGIPMILLGVAMLVYGGIKFVDRTAIAIKDKTFHERADFVRTDPRPEARWEVWKLNLRQLGRLWWPPLLLFALALGLIIIGGILTNM
jgi:hypothetical protein